MDIDFLPQLDVLSTLYSERYAIYKKYTDQQEKILEWISGSFVKEITSQLELEDKNVPLSVLGIGSGNGKLEVQMLMKLLKKFRLIECTVVEPSAERITSYKELVEEQKESLHGVTFDWRQESLEEFWKSNADGSKKFHFISAMHIFYFIAKTDLDFYLKAISRWTKGKILIIQVTDTSCFCSLIKRFRSSSKASRPFITATDIMNCLKTLDVSLKTTILSCECDVTGCFESDSREGKFLLDFLLQVVGCRDDGPPEILNVIQEFLKSEGISYTGNGRLYAPVPNQIIVASTSRL